jgi:hypothetical protein
MAESVSFRELPDHVRKRVEEALKKADVKEPYEIGHEWDIMGFILRQELAREGIERIGQVAQQVATHVAATPKPGLLLWQVRLAQRARIQSQLSFPTNASFAGSSRIPPSSSAD